MLDKQTHTFLGSFGFDSKLCENVSSEGNTSGGKQTFFGMVLLRHNVAGDGARLCDSEHGGVSLSQQIL